MRLLNSWKEIASYLGRGVRTVQRWEKLGLPVRRLGKGRRAPVIAEARDLDRWLRGAAQVRGLRTKESLFTFRGQLGDSVQRAQLLRDEMTALRKANWESVLRITESLSAMEKILSVRSGNSGPVSIRTPRRAGSDGVGDKPGPRSKARRLGSRKRG